MKLPYHTNFAQATSLSLGTSLNRKADLPPSEKVNTFLSCHLPGTWTTLTDSVLSHVAEPSQLPKHLLPLHLRLGHSWPSGLSVARRAGPQRSDNPPHTDLLALCMRHSEDVGFGWHQTGLGCGTDE